MKVFISQPMRGKTDEFIKEERAKIEEVAKSLGDNVEILDSYFPDFNGNVVQFLGKSIQKLGEADIAIFGSGWEEARGCKIEHEICVQYDIETKYV